MGTQHHQKTILHQSKTCRASERGQIQQANVFFSSKVSAIKFTCPLSVVRSDGSALSQETKVPMCLFLRIIIIYVFVWLHLVSVVAYRIFCCILWTADLVALRHAGSQFPDHRSNPGPLQWEDKVLATRPPCAVVPCVPHVSFNLYTYIYLLIYSLHVSIAYVAI